MRLKKHYFAHHCDIPKESDKFLEDIPPWLPKWKRFFKRILHLLLLVDESHPKTKKFFRSYAMVIAEKRKHSQGEFSNVIHPFSAFAIYRERFMCLLYLWSFLADPVNTAFFINMNMDAQLVLQLILDSIFFINIIVTCNVGYCVTLTKEIVVDRRRIIKRYLKSFMITDFIACIPYKLIISMWMSKNPRDSRIIFIRILKCFRLLRLKDFINEFIEILETMNIKESAYTCIIIFLSIFYAIHWWTCLIYAFPLFFYTIENLPASSWIRNATIHPDDNPGFVIAYLSASDSAACHFYGASEGSYAVTLLPERVVGSLVLIFGYFYSTLVSAKILELFGSINISQIKYEEIMYQTAEYVKLKNLTEGLKKRLILYFEYKFQKKYFEEKEILDTLSEHLRYEVFLYSCRNVLEKVPLLHGIPKALIGSAISYLKKEIYLPNDVVIKCGDVSQRMFWVSYGTLAVYYGPKVIEILHFQDGDHFGDKSILRGVNLNRLTVVALEITEIFTLAKKDIRHCTGFVKEISERVTKLSQDKTKVYLKMAKIMEDTNEDKINKVLLDIRRGRILEKERWRKKN